MLIVLKKGTTEEEMNTLLEMTGIFGLEVQKFQSDDITVLSLIGDTRKIDTDLLESLDMVECVKRVRESYDGCSRRRHPEDTVIDVSGVRIGGGSFAVMAGPCSIESYEQLLSTAKEVKNAGASVLRGGAFKPRTSPYAFQGLGDEGIRILLDVKKETGLPVITEIMSLKYLDLYSDVDIIQVGARNMQNFELLKELGKSDKTILLKRGFSNTLDELLMSAEYIVSGGNSNIILCERGIRTISTHTRNTLDLASVPALHEMTHFPVIVDPSHGCGVARYVTPLSLSAVACGADGLMLEVHDNPSLALSDGAQAITGAEFALLCEKICKIRSAIGN